MIDYGRTGTPDCQRCSWPIENGACCCPTDPDCGRSSLPDPAIGRRIDGYLSNKAQQVDPRAIVACESDGPQEQWLLEIAGRDPVGLGSNFSEARRAILALLRAERASNGKAKV